MRYIPAALLALSAFALSCPAATLYLKSIDDPDFYSYDTQTDAWTVRNSFTAQSQLATDSSGNLYVARDGVVKLYNPTNDSWSAVSSAIPSPGQYSNLEITNGGNILFNTVGDTNLQVYNGSSWTSHNLGVALSLAADYDPGTGVFAAFGYNSTTAYTINLTTFTVQSTYTSPGTSDAENRRFGEILDGKFYGAGYNAGLAPGFYDYDLSNPAAPLTVLPKADGSASFFPTGAADPTTNSLYVATLGSAYFDSLGNNFFHYDVATSTYIPLAAYPTDDDTLHNSLAWTPTPEPGSLAIFGVALIALKRRRR